MLMDVSHLARRLQGNETAGTVTTVKDYSSNKYHATAYNGVVGDGSSLRLVNTSSQYIEVCGALEVPRQTHEYPDVEAVS